MIQWSQLPVLDAPLGPPRLRVAVITSSTQVAEQFSSFDNSDVVVLCSSLSAAVQFLTDHPQQAFNLDAVVVDHEAIDQPVAKLFAFAPLATRLLVYQENLPNTEIAKSFDMILPKIQPVTRSELAWLQAGIRSGMFAAANAPTAQLFVHVETRIVVAANSATLSLTQRADFRGGRLSELLDLPDSSLGDLPWRGTVKTANQIILGVTIRRLRDTWFISLSDITDIEADRNKNRREENLILLGKAAAVLAHEIGNPLASIKANLQLISSELERLSSSAVQEYLVRSLGEVSRLSGIVTNYLSLVRQPNPNGGVVSLENLVVSAFEQIGDLLQSVKIPCILKPIPGSLMVHFEPSHFHQIAWNIAKNAIDSMLRARVDTPQLCVHVLATNPNYVDLCFDDNGGGLPGGAAEHLFDAFVTTKGSGTGLGLMVSRLLARQFGADIEMIRLEIGARALLRMRRVLD